MVFLTYMIFVAIVHTDLKHDNILFRPRDIDRIAASELVKDPSRTYDCPTELRPSVVPIVSQSLSLSLSTLTEDILEVVIADLGHSHWKDRHFQEEIQPRALRAPEVILGYPWTTSADIWNFGCIVFELLTRGWLFEPDGLFSPWSYEEDHLVRMTEALETSFDPSFIVKCQNRELFFKQGGSFAHFTNHKEPTWPLRKLLEDTSLLGESDEIEAADKFLRRCLQLIPERQLQS